MGQPLYLEYEKRFNGGERYNDITGQFLNARKYLFDEEKNCITTHMTRSAR